MGLIVFSYFSTSDSIDFRLPAHLLTGYELLYFLPFSCTCACIFNDDPSEFVCAQSPYKMRGLLLGYVVFLK